MNNSIQTIANLVIAKNGGVPKDGIMQQGLPELPPDLGGVYFSDWITVPDHVFEVNDYVRFGNEIARVQSSETFPDHPQNNRIRLDRRQFFATGMPSHPPGTRIYAYTKAMERSVVRKNDGSSAWQLTEYVRNEFVVESGWTGSIKLVPVLYDLYNYAGYQGNRLAATTANVVNCLLLHPHVYMQHPGNVHWTNYISTQIPGGMTIHYLDEVEIWENYHSAGGSIHCGSAVQRTIDFSEPWWE